MFCDRFLCVMSNDELLGEDQNFSLSVAVIVSDSSHFAHSEQRCSVQSVHCTIKSSPKPIDVKKSDVKKKSTGNEGTIVVNIVFDTLRKLFSVTVFVLLNKGHHTVGG